jgi:putative ABC transport system permease protein
MYFRIFRTILNNLRRNILLTAINILGLTLSFVVVILIVGYIQNQLRYDKNIHNSERIFRLETNWASMPPFIGHILTQDLSSYKNTRLNFQDNLTLKYGNEEVIQIENTVYADSTFFEVLPFELLRGNEDNVLEVPFQIYLSEKEAQLIFGDKDPIGEIVLIENKYSFQVAGILKNNEYSHLKIDAVLSMVSIREISTNKEVLEELDGWSYPTYVLVPENTSKSVAEQNIKDCLDNYHYKYFIETFRLRDYNEIYFLTDVSNEAGTIHGNKRTNKILLLISILVLSLAVINYVNLSTANAHKRYKWIGVNRILGASKSLIIIQFLLETFILSLFAFWLSLLVIELIRPFLYNLLPVHQILPALYSFGNIIVIAIGLVILSLLSGIYPAITLSRFLPINLIRKHKRSLSKSIKLRDVLIVFQFVIAILLITSSIFIYRQFRFLSKSDLGFNSEQVLVVKTSREVYKNFEVFKENLIDYPEIINISSSQRIPGNEWGSWCCTKIDNKEHKYYDLAVDPDYLATLDIQLKDGANFNWNNKGEYNTAFILNETAVKEYQIKDPIGKIVSRTGSGYSGIVIGVVEDFHFRGFHHKIEPVILYWNTTYSRYINIRIQEGQIENAISIVKVNWEKLFPGFPFEYQFLDDKFNEQYNDDRIFGSLVGIFSLVTIFIACIGIMGLSYFYFNQQIKNIGIRKVHGATTSIIAKMLTSDIIKRLVFAYIIATPLVFYFINRWLQNFEYRTEITLGPFIFGGLIAMFLALLTVIGQTFKAARKNPVEGLRYE